MKKNIHFLLNKERLYDFSKKFADITDIFSDYILEGKEIDTKKISEKLKDLGITDNELKIRTSEMKNLISNIAYIKDNNSLIKENNKGIIDKEEHKKLRDMKNTIDIIMSPINEKTNQNNQFHIPQEEVFSPLITARIELCSKFFSEYKNISKDDKIQPFINYAENFLKAADAIKNMQENEYRLDIIKDPMPKGIMMIFRSINKIIEDVRYKIFPKLKDMKTMIASVLQTTKKELAEKIKNAIGDKKSKRGYKNYIGNKTNKNEGIVSKR